MSGNGKAVELPSIEVQVVIELLDGTTMDDGKMKVEFSPEVTKEKIAGRLIGEYRKMMAEMGGLLQRTGQPDQPLRWIPGSAVKGVLPVFPTVTIETKMPQGAISLTDA